MFLECFEDARATKQSPSLVHEMMFIFALRGGTLGQEFVDEFDWGGFADSNVTMCHWGAAWDECVLHP